VIDIDYSILVRRTGALAILALLVAILSPVLMSPFATYAEKQAMIAQEQGLLAQAHQRLADIAAIGADAPFVRAPNRADAVSTASNILTSAAPQGSMRILSFAVEPVAAEPKRIDISLTVEATPSGLRDFTAALARATPPLVITGFDISAAPQGDNGPSVRPTKLNALLKASAVFVEATPQ
jgi:hypothetical protein